MAGAVTMEKLTDYGDVTGYNNFYEFGTDKADPARPRARLADQPVERRGRGPGQQGEQDYALEDLLKLSPMEERIYRLRCVS